LLDVDASEDWHFLSIMLEEGDVGVNVFVGGEGGKGVQREDHTPIRDM